eukprot:TRINITY_DN6222_c0_g1_i2.p1 TRINITY_DN6222_c0_g1~~TRINITY_DN6222_c0_g1_i2.p1  ORF type:complete len:605 (-),score=113.77 TRINITY_DN6222_c0_g1_i2:23-1837(-)
MGDKAESSSSVSSTTSSAATSSAPTKAGIHGNVVHANGNGNGGGLNGNTYLFYPNSSLYNASSQTPRWPLLSSFSSSTKNLTTFLVRGPSSDHHVLFQRCNFPNYQVQAKRKPSYRYEGKITFRSEDGSVRIMDDVVEIKTLSDARRNDLQAHWTKLQKQSSTIGCGLLLLGGVMFLNSTGSGFGNLLRRFNVISSPQYTSDPSIELDDDQQLEPPQSANNSFFSWLAIGASLFCGMGSLFRSWQARNEHLAWTDDMTEIQNTRRRCGELSTEGGGFYYVHSQDLKGRYVSQEEAGHLWNESFIELLNRYDSLQNQIEHQFDFVRTAREQHEFVSLFFANCPLWSHQVEYAFSNGQGKDDEGDSVIRNPKEPLQGSWSRDELYKVVDAFQHDSENLLRLQRKFGQERREAELKAQVQLRKIEAAKRGNSDAQADAVAYGREVCLSNCRFALERELADVEQMKQAEFSAIKKRYRDSGIAGTREDTKRRAEEAEATRYYEERRRELQERFKVSIRQCSSNVLESSVRSQLEAKRNSVLQTRHAELITLEETEIETTSSTLFPQIGIFLGAYRANMLKRASPVTTAHSAPPPVHPPTNMNDDVPGL